MNQSLNKIISLLVVFCLTGHLFVLHPLTENAVLCKINGEVNLEKSDLNNLCGEHNVDIFNELSIFSSEDCEDTPIFEHNDDYQPAVKERFSKISNIELCNIIFIKTKCSSCFQAEINFSDKSNLALLIKSTVTLLI